MLAKISKTRGFTLLEILLVVALVALLAIAAISGLMKSQDQFKFKGTVKDIANILKEVRANALSNKLVSVGTVPTIPAQYGAYIDITGKKITIFADTTNVGTFNPDPATGDKVLNTYKWSGVTVKILNEKASPTAIMNALTLFYKPTSAEFSIKENASNQIAGRYATLKITDSASSTRINYIVLFKESGNPETLTSLDPI